MAPQDDHPSMLTLPAATDSTGPEVMSGKGPDLRAVDTVPNRQLRMDLRLGRDCSELRLAGSFHAGAVDRLRVVLSSLDRLDPPVHVDAGRVALIYAYDLAPLAEAARRREDHRLAPLLLSELSSAFARLLASLHVPTKQFKDPLRWPLDGPGRAPATIRRKGRQRPLPGYVRLGGDGARGPAPYPRSAT